MAKISGIYVEIRGDATQLKQELKAAKTAVTEQAQGMSNALNNALSPAQLKNSINGLVRDLNTLSNASKLTGKEFGFIGTDLGQLQRITGLSAAEFGKLQSKMMETRAAKIQEQALRRIADAAGLSTKEVAELGRHMNVSQAGIASINSATSSMTAFGAAARTALAYLSVQSFTQASQAILDAGIAMDSLQRSFVAITGSQAGAAELMAWLRDESNRLGQSFYELAPAFKSLTAAARGTTLEGEQTRKIFSSVTAASTALGLSADQTKGTLLALEQMISKGVVSMEELRRQLGDRLPGAFGMAAKAMGVSTQELNKMVASGTVMADDLLPKLAAELQRVYGQAAQTAALESAQAAVNGLSEEWTDLKNNLFHSDTAVSGINAVTQAIAGLNAMISNIQTGKVQWIWEGLKMEPMDPSTYRGKVNREMVMPAYAAPESIPAATVANAGATTSVAGSSAARYYEKMIADGRKAAEVLDQYWTDYENARIKAITDSVQVRADNQAKDLQLVSEFADKYKAVVLGETEFKEAQIQAQAEAYRRAGAEEVAVAQWAAAEKLKYSRDWSDGATRAFQLYTDNAGNAAQIAQDAITGWAKSSEDALVSFVTTGKMEFEDFADSIIKDLSRIAVQQAISGIFWALLGGLSGGVSSAAGFGIAGELSSMFSRNAKGNVFESAGLHTYANTVVDRPTVFPFAKGVGLMGEAGPEAIMPLKRGPDGSLGVSGGGTNIVINQIEAPGRGGEVQRREENGVSIIDLFVEQIESKVAGSISQGRGPVPSALARTYGLNRSNGALR
ncbi:MAG: phage tail tape measure protein [Desulfomicrobium sp.]